jgi:hypothetical protein
MNLPGASWDEGTLRGIDLVMDGSAVAALRASWASRHRAP